MSKVISSARKKINIQERNPSKAGLENYTNLIGIKEIKLADESRRENKYIPERRISNEHEENKSNIDKRQSSNSMQESNQLSDLLCKKEDDYNTLVNKNKKLSSLVVQASNKLNQVTERLQLNEDNHKNEKEKILEELERITQNYQMYAASFKNYSILDEQFQKLKSDYDHNYNVLVSYQDSISVFLKDYMNLFHLIGKFLSNKYDKNPFQFLCDIKELIIENLKKYQNTIDAMNFQSIYEDPFEINSENKKIHDAANISNQENSRQQSSTSSAQTNKKSNLKLISPNLTAKINKKNLFSPSDTSESRMIKGIQNKEQSNHNNHNRNKSIDNLVDNKKKNIEAMDLNIKKFLDQANTQDEIQSFSQNYYGNYYSGDNTSSNIPISKNNFNNSNTTYLNADKLSNLTNNNESDLTPQFKGVEDRKRFYGTVTKDVYTTQKGELDFKKGDRIEIVSVKNQGNYLVLHNGKKSYISKHSLQPDIN